MRRKPQGKWIYVTSQPKKAPARKGKGKKKPLSFGKRVRNLAQLVGAGLLLVAMLVGAAILAGLAAQQGWF
jgi:hypothetical protein